MLYLAMLYFHAHDCYRILQDFAYKFPADVGVSICQLKIGIRVGL